MAVAIAVVLELDGIVCFAILKKTLIRKGCVRLKTPLTARIRLRSEKWIHFSAVKDMARRMPQEKGFPPKIRTHPQSSSIESINTFILSIKDPLNLSINSRKLRINASILFGIDKMPQNAERSTIEVSLTGPAN